MKIFSYEFVGEDSPEIAGLTTGERRRRYLAAARRSYLHLKTWIGATLFLILLINAETIANAIYFILDKNLFNERHTVTLGQGLISLAAWLCLGGFQVSAIRDELRKQTRAPTTASSVR